MKTTKLTIYDITNIDKETFRILLRALHHYKTYASNVSQAERDCIEKFFNNVVQEVEER